MSVKEKDVKEEKASLIGVDIASLIKDKEGNNRLIEIIPLAKGINPGRIGMLPQAVRKTTLLKDYNGEWVLNHTEDELRAYKGLKILLSNPANKDEPIVLNDNFLSKMSYSIPGKGAVLNLNNELDLFWSRVIRHPMYNLIAKDGDNEVINGRAFKLNDRLETIKKKDVHHTRKLILFKKLESMRVNDYQMIACILGKDVTRITGTEAYRYILDYIERGTSETNEVLNLFRSPNNDSDVSLSVNASNIFVFNAAKNYNLVRIKGGRYYYGNDVLGSDNETCIGFLTEPKNNNILISLQDDLIKAMKTII